MASFTVATFFAILFGSLVLAPALAAPQPKVIICHVDPDGDGAGLETLEVNAHSLGKHVAHGDHLGACFECGDGFTDPPTETCDDGANNGTPGLCNLTCDGIVPTAVCGNGIIETGETCDDGPNNGIPGFCNAACDGQEPFVCGNGVKDPGEECDMADLGGETCETVVVPDGFNLEVNLLGNLQGNVKGYIDGATGPPGGDGLACNSDCTFNTLACNGNG